MDLSTIQLLVLDVDGVLTRGDVTFGDDDRRVMSFNIHDGCALKVWHEAGYRSAILSGRQSTIVERRAGELAIECVRQGVSDKGAELTGLLDELGAKPESACFVGDDLPDIPAMSACGMAVAVGDAVPAVKRVADYVSRRAGGCGAVAEIVELILRKQRRWKPQV
jgi:3-deoxy-D-manno-octulosonate 8-phosphate phosphatase (KDO 8-P phosphatase)